MSLTATALSVLTAFVFLLAGVQKLRRERSVTVGLARLGVGAGAARVIGALEIGGAAGLAAGMWIEPLGIAAATGLTLLLIGAIGYHARAGDYADPRHRAHAVAPLVLAVAIASTAILLLISHP